MGRQYAMKIDKLNRRQDPRGGTVKQEYKARPGHMLSPLQLLQSRGRTCTAKLCLPIWQHPCSSGEDLERARHICTYAPGTR